MAGPGKWANVDTSGRGFLDAALSAKVSACLLKDRSPSCAWDPEGKNPKGGPGQGVLTALLIAHGLKVQEVRAKACGEAVEL